MTKLIQWKHNDERGKQEYEGFAALAAALGVHYQSAWRAVMRGFSSDDELNNQKEILPNAVLKSKKTGDMQEYWREAQRKHRAKKKQESEESQ